MTEWQPAETAPKDGTKFLAYTIHGEFEVTYWFTIPRDRYEEVSEGLYRKTLCEDGYWNGNGIAWWMPLPPVPESEPPKP